MYRGDSYVSNDEDKPSYDKFSGILVCGSSLMWRTNYNKVAIDVR